jgi:hypothetical protein
VSKLVSNVFFFFAFALGRFCFAQSDLSAFGSPREVMQATLQACSHFRADIVKRGFHLYQIDQSPAFNSYIKMIYDEAASGTQPRLLKALMSSEAFNAALGSCYPDSSRLADKALFIQNLQKIQEGGQISSVALKSVVTVVGAIPFARMAALIQKLYVTTPIILSYIDAGFWAVTLEPLLNRGFKFVFESQDQKVLIIPPVSMSDSELVDSKNKRHQSMVDTISALENAQAILERKILSSSESEQPGLKLKLRALNLQIEILRSENKGVE